MDNKWNKCKDVKPPLDEEVLILYKDRTDELKQENLHYGLAKRSKDINLDCERMSFYAQQPGYYDPVYWMSLPNMPIVEEKKVDWHDISADEMTLEQARQAVKDLRKICLMPTKRHGRLIDADEFLKENKDYTGWVLCSDAWGGENAYKDTLEDLINEAPTIIDADKESENEK